MKTAASQIICEKIVKMFNSIQFDIACNHCKVSSSQSVCFITFQLLYSSASLSNYRYVLNVTDGNTICILGRFDNLQDLLKYIKFHNINVNCSLHHLSIL